jgi:hypothetical protein
MSFEERALEIKGMLVVSTENFLIPSLAKLQERDDHVRESWVKAMKVRLVRVELEKCQKAEGVNNYENCKWLSEKYLTMMWTNKVRRLN